MKNITHYAILFFATLACCSTIEARIEKQRKMHILKKTRHHPDLFVIMAAHGIDTLHRKFTAILAQQDTTNPDTFIALLENFIPSARATCEEFERFERTRHHTTASVEQYINAIKKDILHAESMITILNYQKEYKATIEDEDKDCDEKFLALHDIYLKFEDLKNYLNVRELTIHESSNILSNIAEFQSKILEDMRVLYGEWLDEINSTYNTFYHKKAPQKDTVQRLNMIMSNLQKLKQYQNIFPDFITTIQELAIRIDRTMYIKTIMNEQDQEIFYEIQ